MCIYQGGGTSISCTPILVLSQTFDLLAKATLSHILVSGHPPACKF